MKSSNNIEYKVKRSKRAKRMRIAVYCDGSVVVTVPKFFVGDVESFVRQKKNWVLEKIQEFLKSPFRFMKVSSKNELKKNKDEVSKLINERIVFFNQRYDFKYNKINIKNQKTRWGSCSKKGNLNFNYKILFLPKEVRDYIIVHELCHLKEFNHSKDFWNLVKMTIPNYIQARNNLKLR